MEGGNQPLVEGELKFGREEYNGGNAVFPGEGGRANFRPVVGTLSLSPL